MPQSYRPEMLNSKTELVFIRPSFLLLNNLKEIKQVSLTVSRSPVFAHTISPSLVPNTASYPFNYTNKGKHKDLVLQTIN